jgi:transposase InsO family protein
MTSSQQRGEGLVKYKFVVHGFIDGKTRFITGLRVHDNNRASTVARLFHEARALHGTPRRVRGDHGTENMRVAEWVDENHGLGSYLWGPQVFRL